MAENAAVPSRHVIDIPFWEEGLRTFLSGALDRPVNVTAEVSPAFFLLKIRVPHMGKVFAMDHAIDHGVLREAIDPQALLQAEAGFFLSKLKLFFDKGEATAA